MTVNKDRVELFASALESGQYKQIYGQLRRRSPLGYSLHCALGVATDVALKNGLYEELVENHGRGYVNTVWDAGCLDEEVADWYGFEVTDPFVSDGSEFNRRISSLNDEGVNFWNIAQATRARFLKEEQS